MWNRQNAYNHPAKQMERMKSAGLNPNLMYAQGTTGNASGQLPQYQAPQSNAQETAQSMSGVLTNYMDMKQKQTQNRLLEQQIRSEEQNTRAKALENVITAKGIADDSEASKHYGSKSMQQALGRYHSNHNLEAAGRAQRIKNEIAVRDQDLNLEILQKKAKAMGLSNQFAQYRNQLAKDGLTFSSNEWAVLLNQLIEYYQKNKK